MPKRPLILALAAALIVVIIACTLAGAEARLREGECEVCLKRVGDFSRELATLKDEEKIHSGIKRMCKSWTDKADKRFCYYIGGNEDSATSLLRTISQPLRSHMPAEKICDRLKGMDQQICGVKYEKPKAEVDWSTVDFDKMRVKELKQTLQAWGEKCEGCTEKGDFLRLVKKVLPKQIEMQKAAKAAKGGAAAPAAGADKKDL